MVVEREVESFADIADISNTLLNLDKPSITYPCQTVLFLQTCSHYPLCSGSTSSLKFTDKMYSCKLIYNTVMTNQEDQPATRTRFLFVLWKI